MNDTMCVLLIEDNDEHARIIARHIRTAERSMVKVIREERLDDGLKRLENCHFHVVLLDLRLPDSDIDCTLPLTLKVSSDVPIVVLSSVEDRDLAIRAVQEGAQDYICKADLSPDLLIRAIYSAIERKHVEARLRAQANQTQALFDIGQIAISNADTQTVLQSATELVAKSLNTELAKVLELMPHRRSFLLKAGVGWHEGLVGHALVPADLTTQAGYTLIASRPVKHGDLTSHEPVIMADLTQETRYTGHSILQDHQVVSGMSVIIYGKDEAHPYGVLGTHSRKKRTFSTEEAKFLQSVANTLAAAILRRQLEAELKHKIEELNIANRRKDEFLATLSHELRTPLNVIIGNLELLRATDKLSPDFDEALAAIERGARDESQLVSDTLEMSRIITGKFKLSMSRFPISPVIDGAIEAIRFAAAAKSLHIHRHISPPDLSMVGDEARVRQVAWNLLSNAVKFTPREGHVTIAVQREGATLRLSVSDTGKGIESDNLPHVFERFWQEDSSINRRFMGLGLGLAIVNNIVELHGGSVAVSSEGEGKGATFIVHLPIEPATMLEEEPHPSKQEVKTGPPAPSATGGRLDGIKLLLIDDSIDSLRLLEKLLARNGAQVRAFSDPKEGLAFAIAADFDLIISDIGMPEISGYDLISRFRSWEDQNHLPHRPSIALTAYATRQDADKAIAAGFQRHVAKPVNIKLLIDEIRALSKEPAEA